MAKLECPRCTGFSWIEQEGRELFQRCFCGLHKLIFTELDGGMSISHSQKPDKKNLPRAGTKLSLCLGTLAALGSASTGVVAKELDQSTSDTASQLTVLQAKGLTVRLTEKRGVGGGSDWKLSPMATDLLAMD